jgi:transposase
MPQNFIDCDREQAFLLPPSLRDWLPEDHLAWFVIDAVDRLDLSVFYAAYRADGHGRAAYEPSVMVSLVLFAYATDERSSRGIERRCRQDIAYRVITGNQVPDHATIARFIRRHQEQLAELFTSVLRLCARAGLVNSGVVAVDGTKLTASASSDSNVDYDRIAREIIAEAIATDEAEDKEHGDARGDELPPELQTEAGRREWLARELAREQVDPDAGDAGLDQDPGVLPWDGFDPDQIGDRGRRGWLRVAHRQLERERWRAPVPVPRSRTERLRVAARFLEDEESQVFGGDRGDDDPAKVSAVRQLARTRLCHTMPARPGSHRRRRRAGEPVAGARSGSERDALLLVASQVCARSHVARSASVGLRRAALVAG